MYHKRNKINLELHEILKSNSLEYILVLQEKYKEVYNSNIIKTVKASEESFFINYKNINEEFSNHSVESFRQYKTYNNFEDLKIKLKCDEITEDISDVKIDIKIYEYIKENLKDFFKIKEEGSLYDNKGNEFKYKIVENSDNRVASNIIIDTIFLYNKEDDIIGYVNAQYTNLEVSLLMNEFINEKEYEEKLVKKSNISKKDKIEFLEKYNIEYNDQNLNTIFKIKQKDLEMRLDKFNDYYKVFKDTASIDYAHLNQKHRGSGLANDMYFKISNYMFDKGYRLRSSSVRSPFAEGFWNKLKRNNPEKVKVYETNDFINGCYYIDGKHNDVFNLRKKIKPHI